MSSLMCDFGLPVFSSVSGSIFFIAAFVSFSCQWWPFEAASHLHAHPPLKCRLSSAPYGVDCISTGINDSGPDFYGYTIPVVPVEPASFSL